MLGKAVFKVRRGLAILPYEVQYSLLHQNLRVHLVVTFSPGSTALRILSQVGIQVSFIIAFVAYGPVAFETMRMRVHAGGE